MREISNFIVNFNYQSVLLQYPTHRKFPWLCMKEKRGRREEFDAAAEPPAKLAARKVAFGARSSEPTIGEAERSGEGRFGRFPPDYDKSIRQHGGGDEFNKRFVGECASARASCQALRCPR